MRNVDIGHARTAEVHQLGASGVLSMSYLRRCATAVWRKPPTSEGEWKGRQTLRLGAEEVARAWAGEPARA